MGMQQTVVCAASSIARTYSSAAYVVREIRYKTVLIVIECLKDRLTDVVFLKNLKMIKVFRFG
jgi:hypothetical protein